jgi:hypothetical protein
MSKVFNTINYEGSNGWELKGMYTDEHNISDPRFIGDAALPVYSYDGGVYYENNVKYRIGFNRKENKYFANVVNNSTATDEEVLWGQSVTGIKGYFSTATFSTDGSFAKTSANVVNSIYIPIKNKNGVIKVGDIITGTGVTQGAYVVSSNNTQITAHTAQNINNDVELFISGTNPGEAKELFAVSSSYSESSY